MLTQEQYKKAKLWIEANRKTIAKLAGEWIAYNETGIIAHDKKQPIVLQNARASGQGFILRYLHSASFIPTPRLLPVRFSFQN